MPEQRIMASFGSRAPGFRCRCSKSSSSSLWENSPSFSLRASSQSDEAAAAAASSVGDYVQGVHGGKYQFEDPAGGASFVGRQFAESLYSSAEHNTIDELDEEELPTWAQTMGTSTKLGVHRRLIPFEGYPVLSLSENPTISITITNDERSWEHFYSKLVQVSANDGSVIDSTVVFFHEQQQQQQQQETQLSLLPFLVSPAKGHLAPRGGSSNLCDPGKPYSDSCTIHISVNDSVPSTNTKNNNYYLLVIGTEAETWCYWLQLE